MIKDIGYILKADIEDCNFADRVAGIVQTLSYEDRDKENKNTIIKKMPVACEVTSENCGEDKSRLKDLIPDNKKRSVMYFEDVGGVSFIRRDNKNSVFEARIRLVGWLNQQKLGKNQCSVTAPIVSHLISKLVPLSPYNYPPYTRVSVEVVKIVEQNPSIFSRYTYDEAITQYLTYPFEYFAIDLLVTFSISSNCIADFIVDPEDECNTH